MKECFKCGHTWINRTDNPILCPKCKNPDYKHPKVYEVKRIRKEDPINDIVPETEPTEPKQERRVIKL